MQRVANLGKNFGNKLKQEGQEDLVDYLESQILHVTHLKIQNVEYCKGLVKRG